MPVMTSGDLGRTFMIRYVFSIGLVLVALLVPYALIQLMLRDLAMSALVYVGFFALAITFLAMSHVTLRLHS